ncbi:class I SAM-dependent methyltransferase [Nonomuraea indica]|uniref:Class I SAM-dependent methyltransferase n=1 Tax=Nonomuraea indica TaxID=1581193 RepID=A0ABW8A1E7_9ACTN
MPAAGKTANGRPVHGGETSHAPPRAPTSHAARPRAGRVTLGLTRRLRPAPADPLPFADGAFDDVVASLVLHCLEDWGPTLAEMRRVLRPGGRLIASVQHPFVDYVIQDPRPSCFATTSYTDAWTFGGRSFPMTFWRRPLHAMTDAFTTAGFRLAVMCFVVEAPRAATA